MAESTPNSDIPKGMRLVVRAWGAFSALCCTSMGFFVLFTLSASCFGMGLLMIFLGIFVMAFEVPACCQYMGWMVTISNWVETYFKFWMRGVLYFGMALIPIIMCLEVSTFVGAGAIIITAALYGVLAIGRKRSGYCGIFTETKSRGSDQNSQSEDVEMKTGLVDKTGKPATSP